VSARAAAIAVALVAIALVVAQDVVPATPLYHTWQYALALAVTLVVVLGYAKGALRGDDGRAGKRLSVAMLGAAIVAFAGLASGLLGPDTAAVTGTPGTVTPIPALGAAAFFPPVEAGAIAHGVAPVVLRRRGASEISVAASSHRVLGESLLYLEPRPAAYVEAWDTRGAHLTVTQPTGSAFLSPVLLFRDRQRIQGLDVPLETFATPAQHVVVRALYLTAGDLAKFHRDVGDRTHPALLLIASNDAGGSRGITLTHSGEDVTLAGIRVRATIGTYPALAIAAAPPVWALVAGIALFLAGLAWSALTPRRAAEPSAAQPQGA
jgi:hypothetical protein